MSDEQCLCGCGGNATRWRLSERCGHLLAGACLGKVRGRGSQGLRQVVARVRDVDQNVYRCVVCATFHAGSAAGATAEVIEARNALVRRLRANGNGWVLGHLAEQWRGLTHADRVAWKTGRVDVTW